VNEITASGQTVEEAVQSAIEQLDTTRDQVEVSIIDEGKKGLLGVFGAKPAIVKVKKRKDPVEEAEKFLHKVIDNMNVNIDISTEVVGKNITFDLKGENIAVLIGKRGQTLNALQYLVNLVINKDNHEFYKVTVDAEGYRARRKESVEGLAKKMADKAVHYNKRVVLDPMPAFERKIIHHALQAREDVTTESEGKEPRRYVIIKPL